MLRRRRQPFSERDAREAALSFSLGLLMAFRFMQHCQALTQVTMAVVHCHRRGVAHRAAHLKSLLAADW